jgi:hypothetical protein
VIEAHRSVRADELRVPARTGDSLTVWTIPDEGVGGVQSARILYSTLWRVSFVLQVMIFGCLIYLAHGTTGTLSTHPV